MYWILNTIIGKLFIYELSGLSLWKYAIVLATVLNVIFFGLYFAGFVWTSHVALAVINLINLRCMLHKHRMTTARIGLMELIKEQ